MLPYRGVALLTVLLFMQIMALLLLFAVECSQYLKKISHAEQVYYSNRSDALQILKEIENNISINSINENHCKIVTVSNVAFLPRSFWESEHTCSGSFKNLEYHYVIEEIGQDPCAVIQAKYLRISLLVISPYRAVRSLLQSVLIVPSVSDERCQGALHSLTMGSQLWREVKGG